MGILIDASILIEAERGRLDIASYVQDREEEFFISVISASELLHGVWRAKDSAVRARRSAFVEGILATFPILPIDLETARIHAQIWADAESRGSVIGPYDSWLAAACFAHGHALATANLRDFKKVPGLKIEDWSKK
ncbi:MAG: type II toxin-antitoxin system VapC family toxin [Elusimicrobia bacterium]|nr:type II toxin-antitoxin system VapC family toxin [Elusimicrobiota bacterium]